jgi:hypothetical protein
VGVYDREIAEGGRERERERERERLRLIDLTQVKYTNPRY